MASISRARAGWLWLVASSLACVRCEHGAARREQRAPAAAACAAACTALVRAGRRGNASEDAARVQCLEVCSTQTANARAANCVSLQAEYLACLSDGGLEGASTRSSAATCLELNLGSPRCEHAYRDLSRCLAPCESRGTTRTLNQERGARRLALELVQGGCSECPLTTPTGAPRGSDCQAAAVCAQFCCACTQRTTHYFVRACVAGTCGGEAEACALGARELGACD